MSHSAQSVMESVHPLPPLILHPFTESASTVRVLESARASLSLLREGGSDTGGELEKRLIEGRFTEFRMLFYVGKDVCRWIEQCSEFCGRGDAPGSRRPPPQSFAHLLIEQTPEDVAQKLKNWGVIEYARIFSRSIGIFNQFAEPPDPSQLQVDYLRYYYRYADYAYAAWKALAKAPVLVPEQFPFTLYASGEYARMLEREWSDREA